MSYINHSLSSFLPCSIVVYINIEPQEGDGPEADGEYGMPQSKLHGIMSSSGYMLPDSTTENRFQVWFTGGSLRPAEGIDMEAWSNVFHLDRREASRTLGDRAKVLAAKLLLGAEIPHGMEADGSMSYRFNRPIPGHIDVLYTDETLQVLKGNRGSIMVQSRQGEPTQGTATTVGAQRPNNSLVQPSKIDNREGAAQVA